MPDFMQGYHDAAHNILPPPFASNEYMMGYYEAQDDDKRTNLYDGMTDHELAA